MQSWKKSNFLNRLKKGKEKKAFEKEFKNRKGIEFSEKQKGGTRRMELKDFDYSMRRHDKIKEIVFKFKDQKGMDLFQEQFELGRKLIWVFRDFKGTDDLMEFMD